MSQKQKNLFFIAAILAMVLIYIFSGGSVGISLDFGEDTLTISAENYDHTIVYSDIQSLELAVPGDPGTMIDGAEHRNLRYGLWENSIWGKYGQCISTKIDSCVVITLKNGSTYLLNYENAESTAQLYKMFTELLQSKGIL